MQTGLGAVRAEVDVLLMVRVVELQAGVTMDVAGDGRVDAVKAFALVNDVVEFRVVVVDAGVHAIVGIADEEVDLIVVIRRGLRERERRRAGDQDCQHDESSHMRNFLSVS